MISCMAEQTFVEVTGFGSASTTPARLRAHQAGRYAELAAPSLGAALAVGELGELASQ
jgi:hypothetical protein